ncbi:hypothetical protein HELRODRAFT_75193 [Helobdella robusta]|uniref:Uncharacterized protein n=1 Tax=Helobdella robusta TaxID=6412 RepID=T1G225_HELRO|nr:hypothetical protein HELRODRAFT_75193 [Helobdella robusta]ESO08031.1 hypothetical protein HELRODRAFT_75193 [Helobdella robusta]
MSRTTSSSHSSLSSSSSQLTPLSSSSSSSSSSSPPVNFSAADYVVFSISLIIPLLIGLYFFLHQNFWRKFRQVGQSMNFVAVGLSVLASILNGAFVMGIPAEVHYYGIAVFSLYYTCTYVVHAIVLIAPIVCHVFIPTYHRMKFTSAYEYIECRFNKPTRLLSASIFIASMVFFLAVVLYVPALAFSQVTSLSLYWTIVITGGICTLYTAIGGIKAVVYTDVLQMAILLIGLIVVSIIGANKMGGAWSVWEVAKMNGRANFEIFDIDPRTRITFWNQLIGQGVMYLCLQISNQMMVQRYMAVATPREAKMSIYMAMVLIIMLYMLIIFVGLVVHSTFSKCDPIFSKHIKSPDQIFVYFIMATIGDLKGVPGLITATIFAAALRLERKNGKKEFISIYFNYLFFKNENYFG